MIYDEYKQQLKSLIISEQWQALPNKIQSIYSNDLSSVQCICSPSLSTAKLFDLPLSSQVEFRIIYSQVYNEPTLLYRIWKIHTDPDLEITNKILLFPSNLEDKFQNLFNFTSSIESIPSCNNEIWYMLHPCDTAQIVGEDSSAKETYLLRWFSVYILSWLHS